MNMVESFAETPSKFWTRMVSNNFKVDITAAKYNIILEKALNSYRRVHENKSMDKCLNLKTI
jgi:hypothetical protein